MDIGSSPGEKVRISSKGQIVIPKRIRDALKLQEGAELLVRGTDDSIVLIPVRSYTEALRQIGRTLFTEKNP